MAKGFPQTWHGVYGPFPSDTSFVMGWNLSVAIRLLRTGLVLAEDPTASPKSATQSLSRESVFYRIKLSFVVTL